MTDLADFLLARISEDDAVARAAADSKSGDYLDPTKLGPNWTAYRGLVDGADETPLWDSEGGYLAMQPPVADHVARHDPARVLAECDSRRRTVKAHPEEEPLAEVDPELGEKTPACTADWEPFPCTTLRLLALPYADHPDYREEWRA